MREAEAELFQFRFAESKMADFFDRLLRPEASA
jgi:hypothetical protein